MIKLFRLFLLIVFLICFSIQISARARYNGIVDKGGKIVKTSISTTFKLMETYPSATVTVYLGGTTTLASIYSNATGTVKSNPFTADSVDASFFFYADNGFYDIKYSGTGIASPWTVGYIALVDPNEDFNPKSFGAKCDNSTNDTAAFNAIVSLIGSVNSTIVIPKLGPCRLNNITFPLNITLEYSSSGGLYANNSNTVAILGDQIGPTKVQRYYNGLAGQGTFSFASNVSLSELYPEWWGGKGNHIVDNSPILTATIAAAKSLTLPITINAGIPIKFGVGEYLFNSGVSYLAINNSSIVLEGKGYSTVFLAGADNITILTLNQGNSSNQGLTVKGIYFDLQGKNSAAINLLQGGQEANFEDIWILNPSATGNKKLFQVGGELITLKRVMVAGTLSAGTFPTTIQNTNVGIYITNVPPYRISMENVETYSLGVGIAADNNFADGAAISIEKSSIHGNLVGIDAGSTGGSTGLAQFNWMIEGNQFESNMISLSLKGISANFPIHSCDVIENYFTGIDALMIGIYANNIDSLHMIRNMFKNATVADHAGLAVKFAGTITRSTKNGNISITAPTSISPDMNINGNATTSASSGPVFQNADVTINEDSIDMPHPNRFLITSALTYGTTISTNSLLGDVFPVTVTDTVAFTMSNPTNAIAGKVITYDFLNSSGGSMGTITWGAAFKLAGSFTNPTNTKRRRITFQYDGTNWVEDKRSAGDI